MLTKKDSTTLTVAFNGEKERVEITREKFDRILKEIEALNGKKKKSDPPPTSGYEQLTLF